jgi:hypothetical protein
MPVAAEIIIDWWMSEDTYRRGLVDPPNGEEDGRKGLFGPMLLVLEEHAWLFAGRIALAAEKS